jgi:hypothetical protein
MGLRVLGTEIPVPLLLVVVGGIAIGEYAGIPVAGALGALIVDMIQWALGGLWEWAVSGITSTLERIVADAVPG